MAQVVAFNCFPLIVPAVYFMARQVTQFQPSSEDKAEAV
jgi:hypothetical protein